MSLAKADNQPSSWVPLPQLSIGWSPDTLNIGWSPDTLNIGWSPDTLNIGWSPDTLSIGLNPAKVHYVSCLSACSPPGSHCTRAVADPGIQKGGGDWRTFLVATPRPKNQVVYLDIGSTNKSEMVKISTESKVTFQLNVEERPNPRNSERSPEEANFNF